MTGPTRATSAWIPPRWNPPDRNFREMPARRRLRHHDVAGHRQHEPATEREPFDPAHDRLVHERDRAGQRRCAGLVHAHAREVHARQFLEIAPGAEAWGGSCQDDDARGGISIRALKLRSELLNQLLPKRVSPGRPVNGEDGNGTGLLGTQLRGLLCL